MPMFKRWVKKLFLLIDLEIQRKPKIPIKQFESDENFTALYSLAQRKTQMETSDNLSRRERHYVLNQLIEKAPMNGEVAECGCWRGLSAYQIAYKMAKRGFQNRFIIFDSFEGLSDFEEADIPLGGIKDQEARKKEFACGEDIVRNNLKDFNFIDYKKGWIPERFPETSDRSFGFVHIDVDMYQPILDALGFFYPRMLKGGIIVLDDYGFTYFPGAKKATDEFMKDKNDFFLALASGQAFIIKS